VPDEIIEEKEKLKAEALGMIKDIEKEIYFRFQVILCSLFCFVFAILPLIGKVGHEPILAFSEAIRLFYGANLCMQIVIFFLQPK